MKAGLLIILRSKESGLISDKQFMKYIRFAAICLILVLSKTLVQSQSLPVGTRALEDFYRRVQLSGQGDSLVSYTIRPIFSASPSNLSEMYYPDTTEAGFDLLEIGAGNWKSADGKFVVSLLPFNFQLQFNSRHPYGWNDGAMIPAKGIQNLISGGAYASYGHLSIQLNPELLLADNPSFEGFSKEHYDVIAARYYDFYNFTDLPQRFGTESWSKLYWGQSSIRLNFDPVSFGLSTENLWWGPGIRNSLLMSNTAPGFKHLTLNTSRPVQTRLGTFEGQLVAGRLDGSNFAPLTPGRTYLNDSLYLPKPDDWRYFSGLAISWQPKWVPGLFLGISRSFQVYNKDLGKRIGDYIPVFFPFQKIKANNPINKRDQLSSLFFRWFWPEERAEIYFEFGRSSPSGNLRDFTLEPENDRAYIFGLRKQLPFRGHAGENLQINLEVTQLQQSAAEPVLDARAWYLNKYVRHGYTNRGEALGAGIGPGGNLQSLDISWHKGLKRIGLQLERFVHNNDFYYYAYVDSQDWRRHWVDLSAAAIGEWNYKNLLLNARLQYISSLNYQWYLLQLDPDQYFTNGLDKSNLQVQMGLMYRF